MIKVGGVLKNEKSINQHLELIEVIQITRNHKSFSLDISKITYFIPIYVFSLFFWLFYSYLLFCFGCCLCPFCMASCVIGV